MISTMKLKDGLTKRQRKRVKGSSTSGSDKVLRCKKHPLKNLLANDQRLYRKDPKLYQTVINYINSQF